MATASSIEIKRAADQQRAADHLEEISRRLERIERMLDVLLSPAPAPQQPAHPKGRAA